MIHIMDIQGKNISAYSPHELEQVSDGYQHPRVLTRMLLVRVSLVLTGIFSCPLVTSRNTVMLAEFDYEGKPQESFFFDQGKNRKSMFLLKKHFFTKAYWEYMLNGKWSGPGPFRPITNPLNTA